MEHLPRDGMFGLTALAGAGGYVWKDPDWEAWRILSATESRMGWKLQVWEYFWIVYLMGNGGAWNGSWFVGQMFLELEEILGNCLATLFGSVWPLLEEEVP